jgi:muramoyltetrapeptide carboxypeptidase
MSKIKPPVLNPGDTIGLVAPASPVDNIQLNKGIAQLRSMGFKIHLGNTVRKLLSRGFLAAPDKERAEDINMAFEDESINAIFSIGGGYGSLRILQLLDYEKIKLNPKIFVGYSDITALLIAIHQKTGLIVFHGPMVAPDFPNLTEYTKNYMIKALMKIEPIGDVENPAEGPFIRVINEGRAEGEIIGGNLSLIVSTLGTPYEIDTKGKILFIEEVNEEPYRIDRMLTQLILSKKLSEAAGIIICEIRNYEQKVPKSTLTLDEVIQDRIGSIKVPAIYGLCCGHGLNKITIPIGVKASLDATHARLTIMEAAVIKK